MFLGRHQILLLVAFAGTVLANIVPVLMSIDELDVLRSYTHRINVAGSIARSTTEVEKRLPPLARDIAALTSGLELSERTGALLSIENDIKQVSQALRILLPSYQAIVAEPEVRTDGATKSSFRHFPTSKARHPPAHT